MSDRLSKSKLDRLAPQAARYEVPDGSIPGLVVRVTPAGVKTFGLYYRVGARQRRYTLGRYGVLTLHQARQLARDTLADVRRGIDPGAERSAQRAARTVAEACEEYLVRHARPRLKASTVRTYEAQIRMHIAPDLGRIRIGELDRPTVERLHVKLGESGKASANRTLALLSGVCSKAESWGWRPQQSNPCHGIERFGERRMERFLDGHERARLSEALRVSEAAAPGHADYVAIGAVHVIRLLSWTGARLSEITSLTWAMVDLERRWLHLPDSKTGRKSIPLSKPAAAYIAAIAEAADPNVPWVCASETGAQCHNVRRAWGSIRRRADLDDVRLHDLRHSAASDALAAGVPLAAIGGMLGHRHNATTQRYAHLDDPLLRRAADAVGESIEAATRAGADVLRLRPRGASQPTSRTPRAKRATTVS